MIYLTIIQLKTTHLSTTRTEANITKKENYLTIYARFTAAKI